MSYEPTNWKTGDIVTSAKLNKLENAVANSSGGGNLVVHVNASEDNEYHYCTFDKTFREIYDTITQGGTVKIINLGPDYILLDEIVISVPLISEDLSQGGTKLMKGVVDKPSTSYWIKTFLIKDRTLTKYETDNADGYPVYKEAKEST